MDSDPVEASYTIRLRPQRDLAAACQRLVACGVEAHAVKRDRDAIAFGAKAEFVPFVARDSDVSGGQLLSLPLNHAVEADIVFQSVCPDDVVIIWREEPHGDTAGLIDRARDGLEA